MGLECVLDRSTDAPCERLQGIAQEREEKHQPRRKRGTPQHDFQYLGHDALSKNTFFEIRPVSPKGADTASRLLSGNAPEHTQYALGAACWLRTPLVSMKNAASVATTSAQVEESVSLADPLDAGTIIRIPA
jgi:hypothetical protein